VGEWLPEPLPEPTEWITGRSGSTTVDPADRVTLDESINMAFLVVLESMTRPSVSRSSARCLPLLLRRSGRDRRPDAGGLPPAGLLSSPPHPRVTGFRHPAAQRAGIVRDFKQAWQAKDIGALIGLLDPDATAIGDGGGLVSAELRPIQGGRQIARACVEIAGRAPSLTLLERTVNGQPGLVAQQDGVTVAVLAFAVVGDRITHIWAVRNPEKLRPWTTG
jgi:hypothetical protein